MEMTARLTGDAIISTLQNNSQVVNFGVAINDSYRLKGSTEVTKIVTYVKCTYWVNTNIAQYLKKGTLVELQGRVGVNAYKDNAGEAKASLTFHVNSIKLHDRGRLQNHDETNRATAAPVAVGEVGEDLPF